MNISLFSCNFLFIKPEFSKHLLLVSLKFCILLFSFIEREGKSLSKRNKNKLTSRMEFLCGFPQGSGAIVHCILCVRRTQIIANFSLESRQTIIMYQSGVPLFYHLPFTYFSCIVLKIRRKVCYLFLFFFCLYYFKGAFEVRNFFLNYRIGKFVENIYFFTECTMCFVMEKILQKLFCFTSFV